MGEERLGAVQGCALRAAPGHAERVYDATWVTQADQRSIRAMRSAPALYPVDGCFAGILPQRELAG